MTIRFGTALLLAALLGVAPRAALADGPQGQRLAFARLIATQSGGAVTVQVTLTGVSDAVCAEFTAQRLSAQRGARTTSGALTAQAACVFSGTTTLPSAGLWLLSASFDYAGWPARVELPLDTTTTSGPTERAAWIVADPAAAGNLAGAARRQRARDIATGLGGLAVLLLGAAMVRRRHPQPRA